MRHGTATDTDTGKEKQGNHHCFKEEEGVRRPVRDAFARSFADEGCRGVAVDKNGLFA